MASKNHLPIGVFDSGVGGLTVLHSLQQQLPQEQFIYLGDTARLPYGTKSRETVSRYSQHACDILHRRGIKCLVVACNTASCLALPSLAQHMVDLPIIGVLKPGAQAAVAASRQGHIAVIATESTINAGGYQHHIHQLKPEATIIAQSCPLFVSLAEEGWNDGPIAIAVAKRYLEPLLQQNTPDTLLLGCTHFPVLLPAIQSVVPSDLTIIDSAHTTALAVKQILSEKNLLNENPKKIATQFLVTDSPHRFHTVAKRFLNDDIDESQIEWLDGDF